MTLAYLTYLEPISGVYEGQVIDVCNHIQDAFDVPTQLIAVLSPRDYPRQRDALLSRAPHARPIRSPFGWRAWPLARPFVAQQIAAALPGEARAIVGRGPVAAAFTRDLKSRRREFATGYDGRGAVAAEWSEYDVAPSRAWKARIAALEREAVQSSKMRMAVSNQLVDHWRRAFGYTGSCHAVIPCTLSVHHTRPIAGPEQLARRRSELGFSPGQTVICYAGSAAEWQSIRMLDPWLDALLAQDPQAALLMMTRADLSGTRVMSNHGDRVRQTWVTPEQVRQTMEAADFGLLVREPTVTNRVAAPTKFAEYLACGLKVLISPELGDYSQMVRDYDLGMICGLTEVPPAVAPTTLLERGRLVAFAHEHFSKAAHARSYNRVLVALGCVESRPSLQRGCITREEGKQA